MKNQKEKILVIGATGNVGRELVPRLMEADFDVRIGARDVDKTKEQFGPDAEYVHFDYAVRETYEPALEGVQKLYFIAPPSPPDPTLAFLFIGAARREDIEHAVFISGRTTGDVEGSSMNQIEKRLATSMVPYTILRPGWFMQNFSTWIAAGVRQEDKIILPAGSAGSAFIDVRDIADVAVKVLSQPFHNGKTYELTSAQILNHTQVADVFSRTLNRKIEYTDLEAEVFTKKMMADYGWSKKDADITVYLYDFVKTGKEERISNDVATILGRSARSLDQFVNDYRAVWEQ